MFDVFPLNSEFLGSLSSRLSAAMVIVSVFDVLVLGGVGEGGGVGGWVCGEKLT